MRLHVNDYLEIEENGRRQIMRVQKMSQNRELALAAPNEANVDKRNRDKTDSFKYVSKSLGTLQEIKARKVHISPTGKISYGK